MTATALEKPVDDRLIRESGTDAKIAAIIAPVLVTIGFRLVRVRLTSQNGLTLQIMAERDDGTMTVEDCEEVSRAISPVLDVEDPVDKAYHLEISSPGIDRPLVRKSDFAAGIGHLVKIETSILVDNRKRFRGKIAEVSDEAVLIERDQSAEGEAPAARVPFQAIAEARLVLTDDLIRAALRQDKKIRQERKKRRGARAAAEPDTGSEQTGSEQTETENTQQDN
jgi:ribosome maturation factor RimP